MASAVDNILRQIDRPFGRRLLDFIERVQMEKRGKFAQPGLRLPPRQVIGPLIRRKIRTLPQPARVEILDYARYLRQCQAKSNGSSPKPKKQKLSWWAPTPRTVVIEALKLAEVGPEDLLFDLGCGDGRVVVDAARLFGARAIGFEIDPQKLRESRARIRRTGMRNLAQIRRENVLAIPDLYRATVIYLYLTQSALKKIIPLLARYCRKGTRIITVDTWNHQWPPEKALTVRMSRYTWRIGLWTV